MTGIIRHIGARPADVAVSLPDLNRKITQQGSTRRIPVAWYHFALMDTWGAYSLVAPSHHVDSSEYHFLGEAPSNEQVSTDRLGPLDGALALSRIAKQRKNQGLPLERPGRRTERARKSCFHPTYSGDWGTDRNFRAFGVPTDIQRPFIDPALQWRVTLCKLSRADSINSTVSEWGTGTAKFHDLESAAFKSWGYTQSKYYGNSTHSLVSLNVHGFTPTHLDVEIVQNSFYFGTIHKPYGVGFKRRVRIIADRKPDLYINAAGGWHGEHPGYHGILQDEIFDFESVDPYGYVSLSSTAPLEEAIDLRVFAKFYGDDTPSSQIVPVEFDLSKFDRLEENEAVTYVHGKGPELAAFTDFVRSESNSIIRNLGYVAGTEALSELQDTISDKIEYIVELREVGGFVPDKKQRQQLLTFLDYRAKRPKLRALPFTKALASANLTWTWALRPLVTDSSDALDHWADGVNKAAELLEVTRIQAGVSHSILHHRFGRISCVARSTIAFRSANISNFGAYVLGFNNEGVLPDLTNFWATRPYSWAVDAAVNLGGMSEALDTYLQSALAYDIEQVTTTVKLIAPLPPSGPLDLSPSHYMSIFMRHVSSVVPFPAADDGLWNPLKKSNPSLRNHGSFVLLKLL